MRHDPDASDSGEEESVDRADSSGDAVSTSGSGRPAGDEVGVAGEEEGDKVSEYFARTSAEAARTALPPKVEAWRKRSATGAILSGFAFGLREALEPERDEPSIMMETSGLPPKDLPVEADLAEMHPRRSVVRIRPWMLSAEAPSTDPSGEEDGGREPSAAAGEEDATNEGSPATDSSSTNQGSRAAR